MLSLILASIVNFVLLIGVLAYFGRKPFLSFLASRRQAVATSMAAASREFEASHKALQEWQTKWNGAETEAAQARTDAGAALTREREQRLAASASEAQRVKKEAALAGQSELLGARDRLVSELLRTSLVAARGFLNSDLTESDHRKLVTDYLENLSGQVR